MKKPKWESQTSKKHQEWDDQVVLTVGDDIITRREYIEVNHSHPSAVSRLNNKIDVIVETLKLSPRPKSLKALARNMTADDFYAVGGLGEESLVAFMVALEIKGMDSYKWYDSTETLETKKRQVKKKLETATKERRRKQRARNRHNRRK